MSAEIIDVTLCVLRAGCDTQREQNRIEAKARKGQCTILDRFVLKQKRLAIAREEYRLANRQA